MTRRPLEEFFSPASVAVIGATEVELSVGRTVLENLSSYGGPVYPVNLTRETVLGRRAFPSIAAAPKPVDLAVIVTPAAAVPGVVAECAAAKVPAAVIISAGFKEAGARGAELELRIREARGDMRIIGPNCLGVMAPQAGLNATFAGAIARPGSVAFLSQSGALCTAILDWSLREMVGFSAFVSVGSMLDVGWGDLIDYLGDDPHTKAILMYMESIGDVRSFLSAAREVALTKPVIVIKAGRTAQAAGAAASHTGALTGNDEVLDAALRRTGVLRVRRISDLFYMAEVLSKQPRPVGPRLLIVTNAGGPGVLATDALIAAGGELAALSKETIAALDRILPPHWSHQNPVDILGDAPPRRYVEAIEIAANDPGADGLLVALAPQGVTNPSEVAEGVAAYANLPGKPLLASWMGGSSVLQGDTTLAAAGIPTFPFPDTAARAFVYMWQYSKNLQMLYETPELDGTAIDRKAAAAVLDAARAAGRTLLAERESKHLLAAYNIPVIRTEVADTEDAAVRLAEILGYPVVLKLHSHTITHKTEVGGVELNLTGAESVRAAWRRIRESVATHAGAGHFLGVTVQPMASSTGYELILGSSVDAQFGPVLLFGSGGQLAEVFRDHSLALPPLNSTLARRLMERTRIYRALEGVRGRAPVDLAELDQLLVRFSQLVAEQPRIREIDINPLLASPESIVALDARVILHDWKIRDEDLPRLAIRPYPSAYGKTWAATEGSVLTIRPIRPEDEPSMVRFHESLSERSVYFRYFHQMRLAHRVSHQRLTRICFIDYEREMVLVAETAGGEIVAVGRLTRQPGTPDAEFALLVSDAWQHRGLGGELLRMLVSIARSEKIRSVFGLILPDNGPMMTICRKLGFDLRYSAGEEAVRASITPDP
ncbi:MAG TPA: bifunctional acetate--CoA ligase family protein/GNAT family N-acetyltransferase [Bryobacteraceae bacterium]|nr:bifunctional acetate--CoA ligase family protein/GNAT family N-acetyltransferase [Bryobacteraceae bacterium]